VPTAFMDLELSKGTSLLSGLMRIQAPVEPEVVVSTGAIARTPLVSVATGSTTWQAASSSPGWAASPADLIAETRAAMSLNVSELAVVLRVERPTVYAWIAGTATPQAANLHRLMEVADWARTWRRLTPSPMGQLARQLGPHGSTLIELLMEDELPRDEIGTQLGALLRLIQTAPDGARIMSRGLRARGVPLFENPDGRAEIDRFTHRPVSPEG
jgi:DNA-binding transcriptional regulator YiaG